MMLARALAYAGHQEQAVVAFDEARLRAPADSGLARELEQLHATIRSGCLARGSHSYRAAPEGDAASCPDPIRTWGVAMPSTAQEVSNALQNATDSGVARASGGEASNSVTH
jgi:hypothetical protein